MNTQREEVSYRTLDDILFENRNKQYGAYELRTKYQSRLIKSLLVTICCMSIWFIPFGKKENLPDEMVFHTLKDSVFFIDPDILIEYQKPEFSKPAMGLVSPVQAMKDVFALVDSIIEPDIDSTAVAFTESANVVASGSTPGSVGIDSSISNGPDNIPVQGQFSEATVDIKPQFPGGLEMFYNYLKKKIQFTSEARRARLNAKMYVSFIVDEEGLIRKVTILNNVGYGLDAEVQNVLLNSPKWIPGVIGNESVKTEMVLPVSFIIQ